MEKEMKNNTFKNSLIRVLSLVIIIATVFSVVSCDVFEQKILSKEEILRNMEEETEMERLYVTSYLRVWGFPYFNTKLQNVEYFFNQEYVKELPSSYEMARKVTELFIEYFYDEINLENETEVGDALIYCYIEATGDEYAVYRTADEFDDYNDESSGVYVGIGVTVVYDKLSNTLTVDEVQNGGGAHDAGIKAGDLLVGADHWSFPETDYNNFVKAIKGKEGTTVDIKVIRDGEEILFEDVERRTVVTQSVTYELNGDVGYIKITGFKENTYTQFVEAVDYMVDKRADGIIFDLRTNPGGYLHIVVKMIEYLAPKDTPIVSFSNKSHKPMKDTDENELTDIPFVVICNENTASAAELFTSALRDYNAMEIMDVTVVGQKTYGKGVMQTAMEFTDGSALTFTISYYYPPRGADFGYDGEGIHPDVVVEMTEEGDAQLDAAYAEIEKLMQSTKSTEETN